VQYYEIIKDPIDLNTIGKKLEDGKYKTIVDMKKDITLLVKNARTFNEPQSQVKCIVTTAVDFRTHFYIDLECVLLTAQLKIIQNLLKFGALCD